MTIEVTEAEQWLGQELRDNDGEKIGKLDELYYPAGSTVPVIAAVKTGRMSRARRLVALADTSFARDHISVAATKAEIEEAPEPADLDALGEGEESAVLRHYGHAAVAERRLESHSLRERRARELAELRARADKLDAITDERAAQADEADQRLEQARAAADDARARREAARDEAVEAHSRVEEAERAIGESRA